MNSNYVYEWSGDDPNTNRYNIANGTYTITNYIPYHEPATLDYLKIKLDTYIRTRDEHNKFIRKLRKQIRKLEKEQPDE